MAAGQRNRGVHLGQPAAEREAGLVDIREEGKQTFYTLNQECVAICCGQLMLKFAPEEKATELMLKVVSS